LFLQSGGFHSIALSRLGEHSFKPEALMTDLDRLTRLTAHLPEIEVSPYYDSVALKAFGKGIAGPSREKGAYWVYCPQHFKPVLLEALPDIYYETEHIRSWPGLFVRHEVGDDELAARLEAAWRARATKRFLKDWDARQIIPE
jgi:hypothetical protein